MHPMLNVAVRAARQAGRIINRASLDLEQVMIKRKQRNDFVTEVDHAAEQIIIDTLLDAFPHHFILAEESGFIEGGRHWRELRDAAAAAPPTAREDEAFALHRPRGRPDGHTVRQVEHLWIIDPLDGTTNFIHGMPQYAVSIALMQRGVITQALVYDPARDELFTATRGSGAFLNDRRIRVSRRTRLDESLVGTGFPFRKVEQIDAYLKILRAVMLKAPGVRRPGAAALDLAYVACGRYDAFFEMGLSPWDVAAGSLLVSEAGGMVGDFAGDGNYLFGDEIVAATPKVFTGMLALLREHGPAAAAAAPTPAAPPVDPAA